MPKVAPESAHAAGANATAQNQKDQSKGALASSLMNSGLDSLTIDNAFTPSTPYVHKFRTELCKNWQLYGKCKFGDEVSTYKQFHFNLSEENPRNLLNLLGGNKAIYKYS